MKINEILAEAGFFKGLAKSIAPDAVNYRDQTKPLRSNSSDESGEVNYKGSTYRWLGQQWGIQNPATGKYQPAPGAIQKELNFLAQTQSTDQQKNLGGPLKNNNPGGVQIISSDPPMVRFEKKQYTSGIYLRIGLLIYVSTFGTIYLSRLPLFSNAIEGSHSGGSP